MAKKKEENTDEVVRAVEPLTTPLSNGELEVIRAKLNEVIENL